MGIGAELLGLLLQWGMSLLIAAILVAVGQRIHGLRRQWIKWGLAYGVAIFFVMNYVVLPISAVHRVRHFSASHFVENCLAMLLIGLIISFLPAKWHCRVRSGNYCWISEVRDCRRTLVRERRDGQHDLDFEIGTWKTYLKRLKINAS